MNSPILYSILTPPRSIWLRERRGVRKLFRSPALGVHARWSQMGAGEFIPAYIVGVKHIIFITFVPGST